MLWVLDLDGVVWLAGNAIPGSAERIAAGFTRRGRPWPSSPTTPARRSRDYVGGWIGPASTSSADELVTSAQAAASLLEPGSRAAVVGGAGVIEALEARAIEIVAADDQPRHRRRRAQPGRSTSTPWPHAATAIRDGARFVATNTDATFPTPHGLEPGAGALVAYLEVGSGTPAGGGRQTQPAAGRPGASPVRAARAGRRRPARHRRRFSPRGSGSPSPWCCPVSPKATCRCAGTAPVVEPDLAAVVAHRLAG